MALARMTYQDVCPAVKVHTVAPAPVLAFHALQGFGRTKSVQDGQSLAILVPKAPRLPFLEHRPAALAWPADQDSTAALQAAPSAVLAPLDATVPAAASQATELLVRRAHIHSIRQQAATYLASCARQARTVLTMAPSPQFHVHPTEAASLQCQVQATPAVAKMWRVPQGTFVHPVLAPRRLALQATFLPT